MAKATGATVIAPDYRRAPENQFPGPFDDCLAGKTTYHTKSCASKSTKIQERIHLK